MPPRILRPALFAPLFFAAPFLAPAPAPAATTTVSANWAGYAVTGTRFRRVTATWTVSRGSCSAGSPSYSAPWVGLGGFTGKSRSLEQAGTEFDCSRSGRASYAAWYELVPAASRAIHVSVRPGNRITTTVAVRGRRVTVSLRNRTTGKHFTKAATMTAPDVSSAEWIVEAPSGCYSSGNCEQLPLSNFGTTRFTSAHATNTGGHSGTISDRRWRATAIRLTAGASPFAGAGKYASSGATPSALSAGGSAFSVRYQDATSYGKAAQPLPARARPIG